jgi:two-component system phosphate regulon sensor histidine kinase PhoR
MRSRTIRFFILIASVLMALILAVQVYWLNRIYRYESHEFHTSVIKTIRGVYEDLPLLSEPNRKLQTLIKKADDRTYYFETDSIPPADSLIHYVHEELETFNVFTGCILAVYDAERKEYVYRAYLPPAGAPKTASPDISLPKLSDGYSFILLSFPNRHRFIISQMTGWIISGVFLVLALTGFVVSLYFFFKQKFLVEIQKDFINNITHEFSTPLSVIELSVDGLEKASAGHQPEKISKYIDAIRYQSDYLKKHISSLLMSVVAGHPQSAINITAVKPNELLKKAAAQLEPLLGKKSGTIQWQLEEKNCTVAADEDNLYLAVFNILSNAIKYANQPRIIINTAANHKYHISIRDNGPGIQPQDQKKIFKKFYRVQNGNVHTVKGLGLGLYITKKIIKRHRGRITVHSIPGIGTEFKIELPLSR